MRSKKKTLINLHRYIFLFIIIVFGNIAATSSIVDTGKNIKDNTSKNLEFL